MHFVIYRSMLGRHYIFAVGPNEQRVDEFVKAANRQAFPSTYFYATTQRLAKAWKLTSDRAVTLLF